MLKSSRTGVLPRHAWPPNAVSTMPKASFAKMPETATNAMYGILPPESGENSISLM